MRAPRVVVPIAEKSFDARLFNPAMTRFINWGT